MSALRVRPARPADADRIGAIHVAAWRETYAGLLPAARLSAHNAADRVEHWRRQLSGGLARGVVVAEHGGVSMGFAACARQRTPGLADAGYAGEVTALYVLRAAQGRGAGRQLMAAMARRLIAEGYRGMALWVLAANAPARRFYERLDGRVVAEQVDGDDAEVAYGWRDLATLVKPG